jgi:hypothetical protein
MIWLGLVLGVLLCAVAISFRPLTAYTFYRWRLTLWRKTRAWIARRLED